MLNRKHNPPPPHPLMSLSLFAQVKPPGLPVTQYPHWVTQNKTGGFSGFPPSHPESLNLRLLESRAANERIRKVQKSLVQLQSDQTLVEPRWERPLQTIRNLASRTLVPPEVKPKQPMQKMRR